MRRFSFRPTLTWKGRKFKGLRGWSGKPFHPPLTDIPIGAYVLAAGFDLISAIERHHAARALEFFRAATFTIVAGGVVSVLAAMTGAMDRRNSSQRGTQARRTINAHAAIMLGVMLLAAADIALRLAAYHTRTHPSVVILALSLLVAGLVSIGATFGGTLVFDYGFNVETAGDDPVWHESETDVFPGQH